MLIVGWLPVAAIAILVLIFLWRARWRELPFFFLYLVAVLTVGITRYLSYRFQNPRQYFVVYWVSEMAASLVTFFPMYEVFFRRTFLKFYKTTFYRIFFPVVAFVILILTVVIALEAKDQRTAFHTAARAFDFSRTAALVFFIGLMLLMGRAWTRYDLGITLGFAIQAAVALANSAVKLRLHYQPTPLNTIELVAYNVSCLIWLFTFLKPEKRRQEVSRDHIDTDALRQARAWESMLKTWLTPGKK